MGKDIIKSFKKHYYLCTILIAILCYGFMLTSFSMGIDDEAFHAYFNEKGLLIQGRWGFVIIGKIFNSFELLPFWRGFIAIFLVISGLTMFNFLLKKYTNDFWNDTLSIIFSGIAISFPYIAYLFAFMMTTIETGIIYLLVAFSLYFYFNWYFEKKHWINLVYSVAALTYAIAFSEISLVVFLLMFFMVCFLRTLTTNEKSNFTKVFLSIAKIVLLILLSIIFWVLMKIILQKMLNMPNVNYVSNYIGYNFSGIVPFLESLKHFIVMQIKVIFTGFKLDYATKTISLSVFLTLIGVVFIAIKNKKISLFVYGIFILISAFALPIVTGNASLPRRTLVTFSFLISFVFCLFYIIFKNVNIKNFKFKYVVLFLVVLNVFYQSKNINRLFLVDYKSYQYDITKTSQIYHDLKSVTDNNKVVFVGIPLDFNQASVFGIGNSMYFWDRAARLSSELMSHRLYDFFQQHGYEIYNAPYDVDKIKTQIKGMSTWPKTGSIKDCNDYVIVKLGWSFLEQ